MSSLPYVSWIKSSISMVSLLIFRKNFSSTSQENDGISPSDPVPATASLEDAPPPSLLAPQCHVQEPQVTKGVEEYFIQHWPFSDEHAVHKFQAAGFSRVTCCYFPEALDDRIALAARLLTLLFLIDGAFLRPHSIVAVLSLKNFRSTRRYVFQRRQGLQ